MTTDHFAVQTTVQLDDRHVEAVTQAVQRSRRPATRRVYASAWRRFRSWAEGEGLQPLAAEPLTVAAYLAHRAAAGLSMASVAMDRKSISHYHRRDGFPTPTATEGVRRTFAGLVNQAVIAIASVMRDAMLRRSEAAELRWGAVKLMGDGSARATVRNSKTSAVPTVLYVGPEAAAALRKIRPENVARRNRVFGLRTGRAISNRVAAMAKAAGLGEGFSGHSPRVGMAQDLTAAGVGLTAIMVAGRWKSERMPAYYSRAEEAGRGAVARFYGGGERGGLLPGMPGWSG